MKMDIDPQELEYNQMMFVAATNHGCGRMNDSLYGAPRVSSCTQMERVNSTDAVTRGVVIPDGSKERIGKGNHLTQVNSNGASVRRASAAKTFPEKVR
jgi:hypothetical protein